MDKAGSGCSLVLNGFTLDPWLKLAQYWCAIFNAFCFVFLLFFMEETNYPSRIPRMPHRTSTASLNAALPSAQKPGHHESIPAGTSVSDGEFAHQPKGEHIRTSTSYISKLSLAHKRSLRQPIHLLEMVRTPLVLLTFPVVAWCGFTYGSGLVLFNLLNDSTSLILTGTDSLTFRNVGSLDLPALVWSQPAKGSLEFIDADSLVIPPENHVC